jgi:hypothetical protein
MNVLVAPVVQVGIWDEVRIQRNSVTRFSWLNAAAMSWRLCWVKK